MTALNELDASRENFEPKCTPYANVHDSNAGLAHKLQVSSSEMSFWNQIISNICISS